jgi:hypothetical protein
MTVRQRECPGWFEEMAGPGVRLLGRELDLPETAATVRVRDGETLVTDAPFAETKEFVAGFDLLECADLDEAIEVAAKHPASWFDTIEIRPFMPAAGAGRGAPGVCARRRLRGLRVLPDHVPGRDPPHRPNRRRRSCARARPGGRT